MELMFMKCLERTHIMKVPRMFMIIANIYCAHTVSRHCAKIFTHIISLILHPFHDEITIIITDKETEV